MACALGKPIPRLSKSHQCAHHPEASSRDMAVVSEPARLCMSWVLLPLLLVSEGCTTYAGYLIAVRHDG
jgi:hypothetical protein